MKPNQLNQAKPGETYAVDDLPFAASPYDARDFEETSRAEDEPLVMGGQGRDGAAANVAAEIVCLIALAVLIGGFAAAAYWAGWLIGWLLS